MQLIQNYLIKLDELLSEAILKTIDNSTTNYMLKNVISKIVRMKYDLYQLLWYVEYNN